MLRPQLDSFALLKSCCALPEKLVCNKLQPIRNGQAGKVHLSAKNEPPTPQPERRGRTGENKMPLFGRLRDSYLGTPGPSRIFAYSPHMHVQGGGKSPHIFMKSCSEFRPRLWTLPACPFLKPRRKARRGVEIAALGWSHCPATRPSKTPGYSPGVQAPRFPHNRGAIRSISPASFERLMALINPVNPHFPDHQLKRTRIVPELFSS